MFKSCKIFGVLFSGFSKLFLIFWPEVVSAPVSFDQKELTGKGASLPTTLAKILEAVPNVPVKAPPATVLRPTCSAFFFKKPSSASVINPGISSEV